MRISLVSLVSVLLLLSPALYAEDEMQSKLASMEESLWEAFKNRDPVPFREHLADNIVNVTPTGLITGKKANIDDVATHSCEVQSYSLSDWKAHRLNENTVLLTYKAKQSATCEGEKVPSPTLVSSVWVKKGEKWLVASHQSTPVAGM